MSKQQRKKLEFSNFGFSTILLAFVMICIVTISAISLLTANSDYKLSKNVAEKNKIYYLAEETAYLTLTKIDTALANAYTKAQSQQEYYQYAEQSLSSLDCGQYSIIDASHIYTYEIPISEGHSLKVELLLTYPNDSNDSFYEVLKWQSEYETIIHEDETLNLMQ